MKRHKRYGPSGSQWQLTSTQRQTLDTRRNGVVRIYTSPDITRNPKCINLIHFSNQVKSSQIYIKPYVSFSCYFEYFLLLFISDIIHMIRQTQRNYLGTTIKSMGVLTCTEHSQFSRQFGLFCISSSQGIANPYTTRYTET